MNATRDECEQYARDLKTRTSFCYLGLVPAFGLGSWSVEFTHWKVYRARAINIHFCGKAQLTERVEGGRAFVPC